MAGRSHESTAEGRTVVVHPSTGEVAGATRDLPVLEKLPAPGGTGAGLAPGHYGEQAGQEVVIRIPRTSSQQAREVQ